MRKKKNPVQGIIENMHTREHSNGDASSRITINVTAVNIQDIDNLSELQKRGAQITIAELTVPRRAGKTVVPE